MIIQKEITLRGFSRGFHLITHIIEENLPELPDTGLINILVKHTSAGLALNENADQSVRVDFRSFIDRLIPENDPIYTHTLEGSDDMPAHIKSALFGQSLSLPVTNGRINLGTWQGIYLWEHRTHPHNRQVMTTLIGE